MVSVLVTILIIVFICGLVAWLINMAPFLDGTIKTFGVYAVIAVAAILILLQIIPLLRGLG